MGGTIHVDSKVNQATLEIAGAACKIYTDGQQIVIPIIAMTANAFTEDVNASLACGMNAHISKPIDMALLERTIRRLKSQEENYNGKNNS